MPKIERHPIRLVLRGGLNSLNDETIRRQARIAKQRIGLLGISTVAIFEGDDYRDVWEEHPNLATRSVVWIGDPLELVENGFGLQQTGSDERHYTLVLPDLQHTTLATLRVRLRMEQR